MSESSSFLRLNDIPLCVSVCVYIYIYSIVLSTSCCIYIYFIYIPYFVLHSSINKQLGCSHLLATTDYAVMRMGVLRSYFVKYIGLQRARGEVGKP